MELPPQQEPQLMPKVWKDQKQLNRALTFLQDQMSRVLPDHESRARKWAEWDRVYRLIDLDRPHDGSNIVDPEPQIEIDTMKANIVSTFFSQDPNFKYVGQEESDEEQAEIASAYRADHIRRIGLREKFERSIHQLLVFGTAVCKDRYMKETSEKVLRQRVPVLDDFGEPALNAKGKPKFKTVTEKKTFNKWDDLNWEFIALEDFFPIGRGSDIQTIEGVAHRVRKTYDDLLSNERKVEKIEGQEVISGIYYNLKQVIPVRSSEFDLVEYWGRIPNWVVTGDDQDRFTTFEGVITCVMDLDKTDQEQKRRQHAPRTGEVPDTLQDEANITEGCIRLQENPLWIQERPFRICPYTPLEDELYGIGMIEPIVEKWHELNTTLRQLVDNKTLQLLNPTIEDTTANVQRDIKLVKFPRIKANDINGVKPLPLNDFSNNGYKIIAAIKEDMRRASGITDVIQGVPLKDEKVSATEFQGVFQQSGVRIKNKIKLIDELLFKKFLDRAYIYDQQFAETERIVKVIGKKGVKFERVRPEDIFGTFDIVTLGPLQFENQVIMTNKLLQFFNIAIRLPQIYDVPKLSKKIWIGLGLPEHEADDIILAGQMEAPSDVDDEIEALALGQPVLAKRGQNHGLHLQMKTEAFQRLLDQGLETEENASAFEKNIDAHFEMLQVEIRQVQQQQQQRTGNVGTPPNPNGQFRQGVPQIATSGL